MIPRLILEETLPSREFEKLCLYLKAAGIWSNLIFIQNLPERTIWVKSEIAARFTLGARKTLKIFR